MKVVIFGAAGQLGTALFSAFAQAAHHVRAVPRTQVDIRRWRDVDEFLFETRPDLVVNCAAFHNVLACEQEAETAEAVNIFAVAHLALGCKRVGARLVQISTDYVFDGEKGNPYIENDPTHPLQVYGRTKLAGEYATIGASPGNLVVRTSSLFGAGGAQSKGGDFPSRILAAARRGDLIRVREDLVMAPTYVPDLADAIVKYSWAGLDGIVHLAGRDGTTWADFAEGILRAAGNHVGVERLATVEESVRRPRYSVLRTTRVQPLPAWQEQVERYVRR